MKISEYPLTTEVQKDDVFLIDGKRGTKTVPADIVVKDHSGAAYANSVIQEYSLGDRLTTEQSDDIRSGRFKIVRVGGYWTINGHKYWAAHADYRLHTGQTELKQHHMLVVPDSPLYNESMNSTNTTQGGYYGSSMKTENLAKALAMIETDFGSEHILPYNIPLSNAVSGGEVSGIAWFADQKIDLMNEHMVYGSYAWGGGSQNGYDVGIDKSQLALFRARPDLISSRSGWYWLRDIRSSSEFCLVYHDGRANSTYASNSRGVRPAFLIY